MRLLVVRGAKLNAQDSNGNTVLHMAVIHIQQEMFDLAHSLGASLSIKNNRGMLLVLTNFKT